MHNPIIYVDTGRVERQDWRMNNTHNTVDLAVILRNLGASVVLAETTGGVIKLEMSRDEAAMVGALLMGIPGVKAEAERQKKAEAEAHAAAIAGGKSVTEKKAPVGTKVRIKREGVRHAPVGTVVTIKRWGTTAWSSGGGVAGRVRCFYFEVQGKHFAEVVCLPSPCVRDLDILELPAAGASVGG